MANKAIVSKIQEEKYISGTGKKPVYPVTLDEAVKVKKEDGETYTTLINALNSKFGDAIVLGFWQDLSAEERVQEYYMFTFRYGKGMDGRSKESTLNYKEALVTALTCSNRDFIDLCLANEDEDGAEINETLQPQTVASLKDRIENSKYLNKLYLRMIHLHGTDMPTIYLKDEKDNVYKSGDTINFTSYPAKLWVCAENMNPEYIGFIEQTYLDNGATHYLKIYSNEVTANSESTEVEMHFNDRATNNEIASYENPLLVPRYYGDSAIIPVSNEFTHILLKDGFLFYVMPSDYPYNGTVEEVTTYCTQVKQGIFHINDIFYTAADQKESINPIGFPSSYFNIMFTPTQEEESIEPFAMDILHERPPICRKSNNWIGTFTVKGQNAVLPMSVSMHSLNNDTTNVNYVFKRTNSIGDDYTETLELTAQEINEGTDISVRPYDWQDNEAYVPFGVEEPSVIDRVIDRVYDDKTYTLSLKCIIEKSDIPVNDSPIMDQYSEDTFSSYDYYCLLKVPDNWDSTRIKEILGMQIVDDPTMNVEFRIDYTYVTPSLYSDMIGGMCINNVLTQIELGEEEALVEIERKTIIDTSRRKYLLFKINIFSGDNNNPLPGISGTITLANRDNLQEVIVLSYSSQGNQTPPEEDTYPQSSFQSNTHVFTIPSSSNINVSDISGRLTDYTEIKNELDVNDLKEIKTLPSGIFSELEGLADASFFQHMEILSNVPKYAFYNCPNLNTVVLPRNVTYIDDYAFANCTSLESLVIPDSVTDLGRGICQGCTSLTEVVFGAGLTDVTSIYGFTDSPLTDIWVKSEILPFIEPPYGLGILTPTFSDDITGENSDSVTLHFLAEIKIPIQDEELHVIGYDTVTLTDGETVEDSPIADTPWGLFPNATIRLIEVE